MSPFTFSTYSMRPATKADHDAIARWIAADPDHAGKVAPEYFYQREPGIEPFAVCDSDGRICFFFRMTRALRIDIQFPPLQTPEDRMRIRESLTHGFGWLISQAQGAGIRQMIFDSVSRPLINFCKRRFSFKDSPNELVCVIPPSRAAKSPQEAGNQVHQPSQEKG